MWGVAPTTRLEPVTHPHVVVPDGAPIVVSNYKQGPWYIRPIENAPDGDLGSLVGPPGGWENAQDAVDWLMQSGLKDRGGPDDSVPWGPWLGMRFEVLPMRDPPEFIRYCSW